MALTAVPLLSEDSILAWDIESVRGTAPAAATWQSFGRVSEWVDLGPRNNVFREAIAGSGRQAATIGVEGVSYGPTTLGPWQIVDPRVLGFAWGQEVNAPVSLGGGFYRHTATPTVRGALPSMGVQGYDYKAGVKTDGNTWLNVVMPRLAIRGEQVNEDGTGGQIMFAPTLLPHNDDPTVADKAVTLPSTEPYQKGHASIQFMGADTDWRIEGWEFILDNNAKPNTYHTNSNSGKPYESPPEGVLYDLRFDIIADGHLATGAGNRLLRDLVRDKVTGTAQIKYIRTANQDEWAVNLVDVVIADAPKRRRRGKIHYEAIAHCRTSSFEWVDQNSARYFPA